MRATIRPCNLSESRLSTIQKRARSPLGVTGCKQEPEGCELELPARRSAHRRRPHEISRDRERCGRSGRRQRDRPTGPDPALSQPERHGLVGCDGRRIEESPGQRRATRTSEGEEPAGRRRPHVGSKLDLGVEIHQVRAQGHIERRRMQVDPHVGNRHRADPKPSLDGVPGHSLRETFSSLGSENHMHDPGLGGDSTPLINHFARRSPGIPVDGLHALSLRRSKPGWPLQIPLKQPPCRFPRSPPKIRPLRQQTHASSVA